jgi:hypothetical protein
MRLSLKLLAVVGLVTAAALAGVATGHGGTPAVGTYRVTLVNLTSGQPFSPPVAATHQKAIRMFEVGELASDELAAIAQDGDEGPMFRRFSASDNVTQAVDVGRPVTPSGHPVGDFTDTVTFEIAAAPGDKFSIATMLICTNDGFLGLDAVKLPKQGSQDFLLAGYDAGREENTERSEDVVDPCSALGPVPLRGDPNGNRDSGPGITTSPAEVIGHHPGIAGIADLSSELHGWSDPVAMVTIERVS